MRLYNDSEWLEDPQSSLTADPSSSGIGMRDIHDESGINLGTQDILPRARSQRDLKADWQASLSRSQKFFGALGDFGAAVQGKALPSNTAFEQSRKTKLLELEELKGSVSALEHGVKMVDGLEGAERKKFIDAYATKLDGIDAGLGETYKRLAQRPELLAKYKEYLPELPDHLQIMAKSQPKEFLKFVGTSEGVKAMESGLDRRELRVATKKVQTTMIGLQQYVPSDKLKGIMADNVITASELLGVQEHLPDELKLSPSQLSAIQRNDKTFWQGLGVLHGDKEQELLADRAKKKNEKPGPQSDIGKLQADRDALPANDPRRKDFDAKIKKLTKAEGDGEAGKLTPATISVNGKNVAALVDKNGLYFDANTRKQITEGIGPQLTAQDEKRESEMAGRLQSVTDMDKAVTALETLAKNHPRSAAGLFSPLAKGIEYVAGSVNPDMDMDTPATSALQLRDMIIANLHNLSRLSNEERRRIENSIAIGPGGNPKNLPQGIAALRSAIAKEKASLDAPRGRQRPSNGEDPKSLSDDDLLGRLGIPKK